MTWAVAGVCGGPAMYRRNHVAGHPRLKDVWQVVLQVGVPVRELVALDDEASS